jgi:hypothetical protein
MTDLPKGMLEGEKIVAAAICMNKNGLVVSLPRPARHHNVHMAAVELGMEIVGEHEQGFLTSEGRFVRRAPARRIAQAAGQLKGDPISNAFTSEELW